VSGDPYANPVTGVLRNKLGLGTAEELAAAEREITHAALILLSESPVRAAYDLPHLCAIHRRIFGDIYEWAGQIRTVAILNTTTALFVQNELGGGSARQQRDAAYLNHALATGCYPQLAELLAPASPAHASPAEAAEPADRYRDVLARILSGLLVLLAPRMAGSGPDVELFGMVAPGK
jgi:hypothetical protein